MTYETNYLAHFGIPGMKWGIRRYQNPDGTLTPEGRERYNAGDPKVVKAIDEANAQRNKRKEVQATLTSRQKTLLKAANKKYQDKILDSMIKGDSWDKAYAKAQLDVSVKSGAIGMGVYIGLLYANPFTRPYVKAAGQMAASFGKAAFRSVKNSNAIRRGALWLDKLKRTSSMKKSGAVVLGKRDFDIKDIPFGGFLGQ